MCLQILIFDPRISEMQVTTCHEAEWHSNNMVHAVYTFKVRERESKAASNYTEFNLRSLQCSAYCNAVFSTYSIML
jgi:hypothetical protein